MALKQLIKKNYSLPFLVLSALFWSALSWADDPAPSHQTGTAWSGFALDCLFAQCERKILGENGLEPLAGASGTPLYDWSLAVARVELKINGSGFCTAARIGATLFLTNFHCARACELLQFTMGYAAEIPPEARQVFKCEQLIRRDPMLDYSLFQVSVPAPTRGSFPVFDLWNGPLGDGQKVFLPSHPTGRLLEIDRSAECILNSVAIFTSPSGRRSIKHMCDSEIGSSGAPLVDQESGLVVGVHWGGRDDEYNMAVPISEIVDDLRANVAPDIVDQIRIVEPAEATAL